jgi:hypothetical protein
MGISVDPFIERIVDDEPFIASVLGNQRCGRLARHAATYGGIRVSPRFRQSECLYRDAAHGWPLFIIAAQYTDVPGRNNG